MYLDAVARALIVEDWLVGKLESSFCKTPGIVGWPIRREEREREYGQARSK